MHSIRLWSIFAISFSLFAAHVAAKNLELKFQWKTIDFDFEIAGKRQEAIDKQTFIPENVIPVGLDIYEERLFLSLPRLKHGVPATLAYINLTEADLKQKSASASSDSPANLPANDVANAPLLKAYPNWAAHEMINPKNVPDIVSPFHIKIDRWGRLWTIDTGIDGSLEFLQEKEPTHLASPRILIYDLKTDNLIHTYQLPAPMNQITSIYSNIVVDDTDNDRMNAFAFVANSGANKPHLLVYSLKKNESWTVEHNFFSFEPLAGNFSVLGINYQTSDGLYGLTLTEKKSNGYPDLYFHALTAYREFKVSTGILRDQTLFGSGQGKYFKHFVKVGARGTNEQSGTSVYDIEEKTILYTLPNKNEVACWRVNNDEKNYQVDDVFSSPGYPFDVKIDKHRQIWILSNNIHRFIKGDMGSTSANFFIHYGSVTDLIKGTKCEAGVWDTVTKTWKKATSDSTTFQPITTLLFITSILLSLKHLF